MNTIMVVLASDVLSTRAAAPRGRRRILAELPGQPMPACAGPRPAALSGTA